MHRNSGAKTKHGVGCRLVSASCGGFVEAGAGDAVPDQALVAMHVTKEGLLHVAGPPLHRFKARRVQQLDPVKRRVA